MEYTNKRQSCMNMHSCILSMHPTSHLGRTPGRPPECRELSSRTRSRPRDGRRAPRSSYRYRHKPASAPKVLDRALQGGHLGGQAVGGAAEFLECIVLLRLLLLLSHSFLSERLAGVRHEVEVISLCLSLGLVCLGDCSLEIGFDDIQHSQDSSRFAACTVVRLTVVKASIRSIIHRALCERDLALCCRLVEPVQNL